MGLFWTIVLISERNIAKRPLSLKILEDSDFSIHFTYDSDFKSENISIFYFLWQFYDKHVKYEVFQTSFFIILKKIFNKIIVYVIWVLSFLVHSRICYQ